MKLKDYEQMIPGKVYIVGTLLITKTDQGVFSMSPLGGSWSQVEINDFTDSFWEMDLLETERWLH